MAVTKAMMVVGCQVGRWVGMNLVRLVLFVTKAVGKGTSFPQSVAGLALLF